MPAAEFGELSPGELELMIEAWYARERRQEIRAAQIVTVLCNANRDPSRKSTPFELADCSPMLEDMRSPPPDDEEMESKLDALASALG